MKHTPGPWEYCKANPEQGCSCGLVWSKSSDCVVAEVTFKDEDHTKPHEVAVANAKLIAAAPTAPHECDDPDCPGNVNRKKLEAFPELLEACKLALADMENPAPTGQKLIENKLSAAIAKATESS